MQRDRLIFDEQTLCEIRDRTVQATDGLDEQLKSLDACVQKLPPRQQDLVRRRYCQGEKLTEIAAATGQTANALAAILFRGQSILRCMKAHLAKKTDA